MAMYIFELNKDHVINYQSPEINDFQNYDRF